MLSRQASRHFMLVARQRAPPAASASGALSETSVVPFELQQQRCGDTKRWMSRKGARMGQRLDSLREQAHRGAHEEAIERRKEKKSKKKHGGAAVAETDADDAELEGLVLDDRRADDAWGDDNEDLDEGAEEEGPSLPDPDDIKKKMMRVVDRLKESFKSIRGAEPTPELFDSIVVDAYGDKTPLSSVAQVVIVSPTLAHVSCFDPSLASDVRNAIRDSMELNPQLEEDGLVKVPLPRVSMETRQTIVKQLGKQAEAARGRIRNIRRKAMDKVKRGKDGKLEGISKDDAFRVSKDIDGVTDDITKLVNEAVQEKEASVMAV